MIFTTELYEQSKWKGWIWKVGKYDSFESSHIACSRYEQLFKNFEFSSILFLFFLNMAAKLWESYLVLFLRGPEVLGLPLNTIVIKNYVMDTQNRFIIKFSPAFCTGVFSAILNKVSLVRPRGFCLLWLLACKAVWLGTTFAPSWTTRG